MDLGLTRRVALVSGASKGIGLGIATELARQGAHVVMTARNSDALDNAVRSLVAEGFSAVGVVADMRRKEDVVRAVDEADRLFGPPDIAISAAYYVSSPDAEVTPGRGFEETTDAQFEGAIDDAVMNVVYLTRAVLPHMKRQRWGRLINIGSWAMKVPHYEDPLILANLRVAACGLMKSLANELGGFGITSNVIAVGPVRTPGWDHYFPELPEDMNTEAKWSDRFIPMKRMGTPTDIGGLTAYLASERAGWLTGQIINMDGGYTRCLF